LIRFWDIFYLDASTHDTIKTGLKQISVKTQTGDMVESALAWLASQSRRWLIVYNNADDPAIDLSDYFPKCAHGDILITTRNRDMILHTASPESHCRVGDMGDEDALTLLFKTSGVPASSESRVVARTLTKVGPTYYRHEELAVLICPTEFGVSRTCHCTSRRIYTLNTMHDTAVSRPFPFLS
jgi:hypothetical protein